MHAQQRVLDDILRLQDAAEHPVGDRERRRPQLLEHLCGPSHASCSMRRKRSGRRLEHSPPHRCRAFQDPLSTNPNPCRQLACRGRQFSSRLAFALDAPRIWPPVTGRSAGMRATGAVTSPLMVSSLRVDDPEQRYAGVRLCSDLTAPGSRFRARRRRLGASPSTAAPGAARVPARGPRSRRSCARDLRSRQSGARARSVRGEIGPVGARLPAAVVARGAAAGGRELGGGCPRARPAADDPDLVARRRRAAVAGRPRRRPSTTHSPR